ncbi:MAG: hypothetical protein ACRCYA_00260, partial [Cetobacterium sp.]|uniref:hypothetical protein n=1 Tax=Cetobacterium sp. TaxID=2071632 RepID=UPI003F3C8A56
VVTLRKEKEVVEAGITEINETYTTNKTKYDDILERIETCVLPTEFVKLEKEKDSFYGTYKVAENKNRIETNKLNKINEDLENKEAEIKSLEHDLESLKARKFRNETSVLMAEAKEETLKLFEKLAAIRKRLPEDTRIGEFFFVKDKNSGMNTNEIIRFGQESGTYPYISYPFAVEISKPR